MHSVKRSSSAFRLFHTSSECRVRTVYSCPLFYGLCLIVLGLLDLQIPAFTAICCVLGAMSVAVGVLGHYGTSKQHILALQMSHILVICHSILFFMVTSFLLVELAAKKPVVLRHAPPTVIKLLVETKIVGWILVVVSYIVIAISFGLSSHITDLIAKLETEAFAHQIKISKRLKSIERLEKLYFTPAEAQALLPEDQHSKQQESNKFQSGGGTGSQERSSESGDSHVTEIWDAREQDYGNVGNV